MTETDHDELILLGAIDFSEAKRMQSLLSEKGVRIRLASDPETCSKPGCKPSLQLWVAAGDLDQVRAFLAAEQARAYEGLEIDPRRAEASAYDPETASATCPACGTEFSTTLTECPDCGLGFAV